MTAKITREKYQIVVPRLVDASNNNAQCLNTRAMLARFNDSRCEWTTAHYKCPDVSVAKAKQVRLVRLWGWRFWKWRMFLLYQQWASAIFYPGFYWHDEWALRLRSLMGRRIPIIATLEGLAGNKDRQKVFSDAAGHPVYCGTVSEKVLAASDRLMHRADHIIAISPFLARMGREIYGDKFSVLPLGINEHIFHANGRKKGTRFLVVGAGTVYERKRPWIFLELAKRFPEADFLWIGEGEQRTNLLNDISAQDLKNLDFCGSLPNDQLADEFRKADLFVLPAYSEGVPKVSQEAAACGLPVILYGFYEAPSVVHGENGYVVWNDEECFDRVHELIRSPCKAEEMGQYGARMASDWAWDSVASRWEQKILSLLG